MALENTKTQGLLWEAVVATTKWLFLGQEKNRLFGKACEEENKETMDMFSLNEKTIVINANLNKNTVYFSILLFYIKQSNKAGCCNLAVKLL